VTQEQTRTSFGHKWSTYPIKGNANRAALSDPDHRIERNGWTREMFEEWIDGKHVLDAGCGMGWYTAFLRSVNPSGLVVGVDIAEKAIETGSELGNDPLVVGDLLELPFKDGTFDYIACEEVLHHTPDPAAGLEELVRTLKPGGTYTMYVYKEKPLLREMADTAVRERTTELSVEECIEFAEQVTEIGKQLHDIDETIRVPDVPILDIEGGEYDVQEFFYRYFTKCYYDWETEDWDTSVATNFDWYHPEYAERYTETELRDLTAAPGLEIQHLEELMSGFSVRAVKR
jgi:ubiquinone/menaquinone biosynthesis C-methylase UbiE